MNNAQNITLLDAGERIAELFEDYRGDGHGRFTAHRAALGRVLAMLAVSGAFEGDDAALGAALRTLVSSTSILDGEGGEICNPAAVAARTAGGAR